MILTPQFINLLSKKNFMESCQHQTNDQERLKILSQQAEAEQRLSNISAHQQILGLKLPISWPHLTNQIVYGS